MFMNVKDEFGRSFQTLRVSLTSTCNFGCVYCVDSEDKGGVNKIETESSSILNYSEIANIVIRLHKKLHFQSIRLTGGEPTLYPNLVPFVEQLTSHGIQNIKMTTNGFLLKQKHIHYILPE